MPIDIGRYNETFKAFADFAKVQMDDGKGKAVARAALGGRTVSAAAADRAFAFTRSQADKSANDIARDIFRQTVADMFGGESNIPPERQGCAAPQGLRGGQAADGAPPGVGLVPYGAGFDADEISGPDILADLAE